MFQTHDDSTELSGPPKPALTFRVGIVGHRPNRLKHADLLMLSARVKDILVSVKTTVVSYYERNPGLFSVRSPVLRAVTPLAEGVDRLFAEQALSLGFQLGCPLPFARGEFEKDFMPPRAIEDNSLSRFRELIAKAETIFELDGDRKSAGSAYGACGRVVVNQADLLLIVWDGERLGKTGGTEETAELALTQGVPVVLIDAKTPHTCQILESTRVLKRSDILSEGRVPDVLLETQLKSIVTRLIALPDFAEDENAAISRNRSIKTAWFSGFRFRAIEAGIAYRTFLKERKPLINFGIPWKCFRDMFGDLKRPSADLWVEGIEKSVEKEWPRDDATAIGRVGNRLRPFYAWPDKLAVTCGDTYRSAFLTAYLMAAVSVGLALLPVAMGWSSRSPHPGETLSIWLELCSISIMLVLIVLGRWKGWHERWLDYRLTAELVRHIRLVAPLGGTCSLPSMPAHLSSYMHPGKSWMAWYARAVDRELGFPQVKMTSDHLLACLANLIELLNGQINFHHITARRSREIEHRLHVTSMSLLGMTIAAGLLHLTHSAGGMMTLICGFFPALGAAFEGINNQGEFHRIEKRSDAMAQVLEHLVLEAAALQNELTSNTAGDGESPSMQLAFLADKAARLMVMEVLDWRVVFLDRPLKLV
jgi:hypothetical protein